MVTRAADFQSVQPWNLALAAALAAAGAVHCLLIPEHMAMSAVFGAGFLAAGVAQLGMAGLAVVRPSRLLYLAVIASTFALSSMYAYNVVVGLPFHGATDAVAGDEDHAGQQSDTATISADVAHSDDRRHASADEHSDGAHPSSEVGSLNESTHADANDHEDPVSTDHHEDGLVIGGGEPVDAYGGITQFAQLSAAAIAAVLLVRSRRPTV